MRLLCCRTCELTRARARECLHSVTRSVSEPPPIYDMTIQSDFSHMNESMYLRSITVLQLYVCMHQRQYT